MALRQTEFGKNLILIERNPLKDSNYCFNSLAIRLCSKDLKHLIPGNRVHKLQG